MRFGVCGGMSLANVAAAAGYDYAEGKTGDLLKPLESEEIFLQALEEMRGAGIPYEALNIFVPGGMKITGPAVDFPALQSYVKTVMRRAERAGVEIIVFGSGGARRIPEGFDRGRAHEQLVQFCSMVGPVAHDHGITVAVEPLHKADCNVLNTVAECAGLVNEVAHPGVRLLVDSYHMMVDGDPVESIVTHGALLAHVHIATVPGRLPPAAEECDLKSFFDALLSAKYNGRVSIEANAKEPDKQFPAALAFMRDLSKA